MPEAPCVHQLLATVRERDTALPDTDTHVSDQVQSVYADMFRDLVHGKPSVQHIEGAFAAVRMFQIRCLALLGHGRLPIEMHAPLDALQGELYLIFSRMFFNPTIGTETLEQMWQA